MKNKAEIMERKFVFEKELEKHKAEPEKYEKAFTELIENNISLLGWVLK